MYRFVGSRSILRLLSAALGLGTALFGLGPIVAPRMFAELFGLPYSGDPPAAVAIRSVGVRDLVNGLGLLATLDNPRAHRTWLLVRFASDTGDALACQAALRRGPANPRLRLLGVLAAGAAAYGAFLLAAQTKNRLPEGRRFSVAKRVGVG